MKKALAVFLAVVSLSVSAKETPFDEFSMNDNFTNDVTITLVPVDNVAAACQAESRKRGFNGFTVNPGKKIDACSFWKEINGKDTCTIVVPRNNVTYWNLGHELRHCVQGSFHK
jgi:hypothetical protein